MVGLNWKPCAPAVFSFIIHRAHQALGLFTQSLKINFLGIGNDVDFANRRFNIVDHLFNYFQVVLNIQPLAANLGILENLLNLVVIKCGWWQHDLWLVPMITMDTGSPGESVIKIDCACVFAS